MSSSSLLRTSSSWSAMSASCSLSIIPLVFATVRIQSASDSEIRDEKEFEAAAQSFVPVLNISAQAERTAPQPQPRPQLPATWVRPLPPLLPTHPPPLEQEAVPGRILAEEEKARGEAAQQMGVIQQEIRQLRQQAEARRLAHRNTSKSPEGTDA
ncbi:hypothetical protein B0H14DRAFT_3862956 [Mycena olivaceomarginata]|nr:hypothetical protein B0H14DRAFT_3862956 [Mycena olivaceomarginata]